MKRLGTSLAGLFSLALVVPALAATPHRHAPARGPATAPATAPPACCRIPTGTVVAVELNQEVTTKVQKTGDEIELRLAAPLVVDGQLILRAGTPGVGSVIEAAKPGLGGKPAKLVLSATYLRDGRIQVPLQGLQLAAAGKDNTNTAQAIGLTGLAFGPLGFVGFAVKGGDVDFPAGTGATAKVASDIFLPSLGRATRAQELASQNAQAQAAAAEADTGGLIQIDPPPPGKGQVVFFRAYNVLGTGQWFNVRENGQALGKLTNGAYFIQVTDPGVHTYTATTEPEAKDKLNLQIAPGETYFVEGSLTRGLAIGLADLTPSNHAAFDKASKHLKLAPPPSQDNSQAASNTASNAASNDATNAAAH